MGVRGPWKICAISFCFSQLKKVISSLIHFHSSSWSGAVILYHLLLDRVKWGVKSNKTKQNQISHRNLPPPVVVVVVSHREELKCLFLLHGIEANGWIWSKLLVLSYGKCFSSNLKHTNFSVHFPFYETCLILTLKAQKYRFFHILLGVFVCEFASAVIARISSFQQSWTLQFTLIKSKIPFSWFSMSFIHF